MASSNYDPCQYQIYGLMVIHSIEDIFVAHRGCAKAR